MNTINSEQIPGDEARKLHGRELLDTDQASSGERVRGLDGWIISVREHDAGAPDSARAGGLTVSRRFELAVSADANRSQTKSITLYCSSEELAGFRLACAEAARAELELSNPLAGLRHYRTAMLAFPFLPGLDVLRDQLMASAWKVVDASLQSAGECLKDRRMWASARPALERAKALIEIEDALSVSFAARYEYLNLLHSRLAKLAPTNKHDLAPNEERDILRGLCDEMAGDPDSYWHLPGWRSARERLNRLESLSQLGLQEVLFNARRQFVADISRAYNDASAGRFLERYLQDGNPPPSDESIAQLQLEETEALLRRADQLMHLHSMHEAEAQAVSDEHTAAARDAATLLHDEISKLEGWRRDLRALIAGLSIARHHATLGLRDPEQIEVARYVLCIGGRKPATSLRQVPHMFVGHPSLLHCKAYVETCAARRRSQERLFKEITVCLQFDAATQPEQLPLQATDDIVQHLRSRLEAKPATYPIEVAWEKLREMKRQEPDDACGLQKDLIYFDSDDHRREHESLPAIEAVVQRKVNQIHHLREWLLNFTADTHVRRTGFDFPGAVDWKQEKKDIEVLRDSGPVGLTEAQARCKLVKSGASDGAVNGLWPLERMCRVLSQKSMLVHLRQSLDESQTVLLCAAAQALNQQRHALWLTHEQHLRECDTLAADIEARIENYTTAWDAFEAGHRALMTIPFWRRRRIAESAEWQHFQRAAERFCGICPDYSVFRSKLQEVRARFNLVPDCLDEHEGREKLHA